MSGRTGFAVVVCLLWAALPCEADGQEIPPLRLGEKTESDIAGKDEELIPRRFSLQVEADATITLEAESLVIDPAISVWDESRSIARDDDSGVESNARLTFEAKADVVYELVVESLTRAGPFYITAYAGRDLELADPEDETHRVQFRIRALRQAEQNKDLDLARHHVRSLARLLLHLGRTTEAQTRCREALAYSTRLGEDSERFRDLVSLARVQAQLDQLEQAQQSLQVADEVFARLADVDGQMYVDFMLVKADVQQRLGDHASAEKSLDALVELFHAHQDHANLAVIVETLG